jgi:hypothetical protein
MVISDKRPGSGNIYLFSEAAICMARENRKKFLGFEERKRRQQGPLAQTVSGSSDEAAG